jgi:hypothetical protein
MHHNTQFNVSEEQDEQFALFQSGKLVLLATGNVEERQ